MNLAVITPPAVEPVTMAEVKQYCRIDASNAEPAPGAPTAALAGAGGGNVDNGAHRYLIVFGTATGKTEAGVESGAVTVADKTANGRVALTAIPLGGSAVTYREIYRTTAGGTTFKLLATLNDNTTTTYTDNIADASLGAGAPTANTTEDPMLVMLVEAVRRAVESKTRRALVTQTLELGLDSFPEWTIKLPCPPLQSVSSIVYIDSNGATQTLDPAQYKVDSKSEPGRITPIFGNVWPITRWETNAVLIRYVAGYGAAGALPAGLKNWMLMRIKTLWDNREAFIVEKGAAVALLPTDYVDGLLDPYVCTDFGWECMN